MSTPLSINELPEEILRAIFFESLEQGLEQGQNYQRPECLVVEHKAMEPYPRKNRMAECSIECYADEGQIQTGERLPSRTRHPSVVARICIAQSRRSLTLRPHEGVSMACIIDSIQTTFTFSNHLIDYPRECRLTSFGIGRVYDEPNAETLYTLLLEQSHPLLRIVLNLELREGSYPETLFNIIGEASSLQRLRIRYGMSHQSQQQQDTSTPPCPLLYLKHLEMQNFDQLPMLLLQNLDLSNIYGLKLKAVYGKAKELRDELTTLVLNVP
ncbi:hypothetical protein FRB95_001136 [Tulasnella sp. JGI-2019a]|nr:hypothetical protein FRB95_001136 [Tulasnella sp. JGI-2019a]